MKKNLVGSQEMSKNILKELSEERKTLQEQDLIPKCFTTASWQVFKSKYLYQAETAREQYLRIAETAARHLEKIGLYEIAKEKFFHHMWEGNWSPSTPTLANMGVPKRGMPVSCSGTMVYDEIESIYEARKEIALLTKNGFGTSYLLSNIRPRGSVIKSGGQATGAVPVFNLFKEDMRYVTQGNRRGAVAAYLDIEHDDFYELADDIKNNPDDANIGWVIKDSFIERLQNGDQEANKRYKRVLKLKCLTGKGYFIKIDEINRRRPQAYINNDLYVSQSNLCTEVILFNGKHEGEDHSFTCIIASMNDARYDEWKDTDAVYWLTFFLDCVAEEFIQQGKKVSGLENAVRFTEKGRAIGIGQMGLHTYLQNNLIPFDSLQGHLKSQEIAKHIWEESEKASKFLAEELGEPKWCKGTGLRNTHRIAIAPTKTISLFVGGVSEGVSPDPKMVFIQSTAGGGQIERLNPKLLSIMKERGVYNKANIEAISKDSGSVQNVDWLTPEEKAALKTGFEINQKTKLRMDSARGMYIDQWQSLNYFFSAHEKEENIADFHQELFEDPNILGSYYLYMEASVKASSGNEECESCQ